MTFNAKLQYLNRETKANYKDPSKTDYIILFMDGTDTERFFCTPELFDQFGDCKPMQSVSLLFDYNPKFRSVRLKGIA